MHIDCINVLYLWKCRGFFINLLVSCFLTNKPVPFEQLCIVYSAVGTLEFCCVL